MRPNFVCTVCHQSFTSLEPFKYHLESAEHELAYGIRLKNSDVGSYFCNCCHACVNTLLIWKSHAQGMKHIKVANAFSLAYPSFNFNKPARVLNEGLLDQNVELPDHLLDCRDSNKPHINMKPMADGAVVIGITEISYDGPGLYTCKLCTDNFNEGNKAQHLLSTRHRVNVFKRWDMALYDEAIRVKEVGKSEFADRCNAIASDIFPVEQGVLNKTQKMIYERIMGTSTEIDYLFFADKMATLEQVAGAAQEPYQNRPPPPLANYGPPPPVDYGPRPRRQYRPPPPVPSYRPPPPTYRPPPPARAAYERPYHPPRRPYYPPEPEYTEEYPEPYHQPRPRYPQPRYRDKPRAYAPPLSAPDVRPAWTPSPLSGEIIVDHDIKCDLAMESARILLKQLNIFMQTSSTSGAVTRVDILKTQILFDEIVKMSYPLEKDCKLDDDYITVFHNGRLTLKRKEPVRIVPVETNVITDDITDYNGKEVTVLKLPARKEVTELKITRDAPKEVVKELSVPKEREMSVEMSEKERMSVGIDDKESESPAKDKERTSSREKDRSSRERGSSRDKEASSRDSSSRDYRERSSRHGDRRSSRSEQPSPHGHPMMYPGMSMMPGHPGPPGVMHPGMAPQGMPQRMPIFPVRPPSGAPGLPGPQEFQNLPRILDPWGRPIPASMVPRMPYYQGHGAPAPPGQHPPGPPSRGKSPRKRSPSPTPKRNRSSSPRKHSPSPPRRYVTKTERPRRSPRRSPAKRAPARSPPRRQRSPARKNSPRRRSPRKKSPEKKEDDEGTLFLEDGAYEALLKSLT